MPTASRLRRVPAHLEIIGINSEVISRQIFEGMEKSGEQVAVHVNRKGEMLSVLTVKTADVPDALSMDQEFITTYQEYLKDLKTGEALVMMTTEGSNHIGIYKLPPGPLH